MNDSKLIFFTGVPGSRWSGIAQRDKTRSLNMTLVIEHLTEFINIMIFLVTVRVTLVQRMEFPVDLSIENLLAPFNSTGIKLLMSHEWALLF